LDPLLDSAESLRIKPRRNKYFKVGPNISMTFVPGGSNISLFGPEGTKIGGVHFFFVTIPLTVLLD